MAPITYKPTAPASAHAVNTEIPTAKNFLTMPNTSSLKQEAQSHQALVLTIIAVLGLFVLIAIIGALLFLIRKIKQAVGVQWHPELGEFVQPKRGFRKWVREFPKDVKEFFTPAKPYNDYYPDYTEPQDSQWAHTYIKNTRGLEGHGANVLIPRVWMKPKGSGTPLNTPQLMSDAFSPTDGGLYTHGSVDITELVLKTAGLPFSAYQVDVKYSDPVRENTKEKGGKYATQTHSPVFSIAVGEIFPGTPPPTYYSPPPFYYQIPASAPAPAPGVGEEESDLAEMGFAHLNLPIEWKMYVPDRDSE
ncbi:hypothetical protein QCA50_004367 [Cerrena zonata]|uniref:Uncharacterized protein n=1 Tax=Cerrena zonata TaxID=2478898 RepID=A0AAW0GNS8_9APHY